MESELISELSKALHDYRNAITRVSCPQAKEDYSRLAAITEDILTAIRAEDIRSIGLGVLGFFRQASDSLSRQPPEFKPLAHKIAAVEKKFV
jgi:hypothetical protein